MKILQVCPIFPPRPKEFGSGVTQVVYNVSKELAKRGHKVEVYTSNALDVNTKIEDKSNLMLVDGIKVYHFPYVMHYYTFFLTPFMISAVRKNLKEFDVIHIHDLRAFQSIVVYYYARKYGVPYVLQAHGSLPRIMAKRRLKWFYDVLFGYKLLRDASKVIALSRVEADQYRRMGVPEEKIAIIPNGIDLSEYANLPPKGAFKKKFGIPEDKKVILYLGRIHRSKGIDLLIKAYAYLIEKMGNKDAVLVIAGPDDGYLNEAKALADSLGIYNSVMFTGFISSEDKLKALVDADVFVTPSFYGFPMTFLEACATGTPIITTTLGDTLEWINGNVGYVSLPTYSHIAEAIYRIVSDDELHEKFSRNCRGIVRSEFSLEKVVDRLEQVYRAVAEG